MFTAKITTLAAALVVGIALTIATTDSSLARDGGGDDPNLKLLNQYAECVELKKMIRKNEKRLKRKQTASNEARLKKELQKQKKEYKAKC